jgi:hypothetical protein
MSQLIRTEDSAHWYRKTGEPAHRVIGKNGKEKNTTIREARELDLVPSVTTILKLWPKQNLQNWIIEQSILSALTLPRKESEDLQAFAKRVVEDSQAQAKAAAEFGTRVHNAIAGEPIEDELVKPFFNAYKVWSIGRFEPIWQEKVLVSDLGYAGRADSFVRMDGKKILLDFKCRTVKDRNKPPIYDTDGIQLVAYMKCDPEIQGVASVVIDSVTPSEPIMYEWPADAYEHQFGCFKACLNLWKHVNYFDL